MTWKILPTSIHAHVHVHKCSFSFHVRTLLCSFCATEQFSTFWCANTPFFCCAKYKHYIKLMLATQANAPVAFFALLRRETVDLDMSLCLVTGLSCSLKPSVSRRLVSPLYWLEGTRTLNFRLRRATPYPLGHKDFPFNITSVSPYHNNIAATNSIPGCTRRFLYRRKPLCHAAVRWAPSGIRIFLNAQNFLSQSPEILFFVDVCFHAL